MVYDLLIGLFNSYNNVNLI